MFMVLFDWLLGSGLGVWGCWWFLGGFVGRVFPGI